MVTLIVGYDESRVIGKDGQIPWNLPDDMAHFKRTTTGHTVVMGRKTWDSLPDRFKPLPNRDNIVITRHPENFEGEGARVMQSLEEAVAAAPDCFIIGGAEIYRYALDHKMVDRIIASEIGGTYDGDTFFPELQGEWDKWNIKAYDLFTVCEYLRID